MRLLERRNHLSTDRQYFNFAKNYPSLLQYTIKEIKTLMHSNKINIFSSNHLLY